MLPPEELKGLCELCGATGVQFISDEISHGRTSTGRPRQHRPLKIIPGPLIMAIVCVDARNILSILNRGGKRGETGLLIRKRSMLSGWPCWRDLQSVSCS
jgi:hypothetical protein